MVCLPLLHLFWLLVTPPTRPRTPLSSGFFFCFLSVPPMFLFPFASLVFFLFLMVSTTSPSVVSSRSSVIAFHSVSFSFLRDPTLSFSLRHCHHRPLTHAFLFVFPPVPLPAFLASWASLPLRLCVRACAWTHLSSHCMCVHTDTHTLTMWRGRTPPG